MLCLAGFVTQAHAAASCTLSTPGIVFGNYDPTSVNAISVTTSFTFSCNFTGTGFTADLTLATGNSGSYTTRTLLNGGQQLGYNIYVDTAHSEIFGNGTAGTYYFYTCYPGGGYTCAVGGPTAYSGAVLSAPVYGVLPAGEDVSAGIYTDTMVMTLTF
jgi:spore coat protein U-like protein